MNLISDNNIIGSFSDMNDGDLSFYTFGNDKSKTVWNELSIVKQKNLREPVYLSQAHGANIVEITDSSIKWEAGRADALITKLPNIPIGVFSADCLPLLMWSKKYVAAIHAGWRGTLANISEKVAHFLAAKESINTSEIHVALGACIDTCCLEVGDEVYSAFQNANPSSSQFFTKKKKWHLNLKDLNIFQLTQAGIKQQNINKEKRCTFCNEDDFYSFRRQKKRNGTMFSFIVKTSQIREKSA